MNLFDELKKDLQPYLDAEKIAAVHEAFLVAEKAHQGQSRRTGEPYITHPVAVARILASMHMDHQSIMAALMHDVIEDTYIEKTALIEQFGEQVANLVDGVSKLTQMKFESRAIAQAENFRKMLLAMAQDIRVIIIKLADRLHNMRTLGVMPPEKKRRIARETLEIYAPIANRLGMHKFYVEFEDLGFASLYPLRYKILKESVLKARGNRKEIMNDIKRALEKRLHDCKLAILEITGREKHLYSIYKKMRNKHLQFSEIMDVYAFRVMVDNVDTCYRTLGVVHSLYKPVPARFKDYIAIPKANSYQSLHTTLFGPYGVPIEIQIRTLEMNQVAENGIASHWLYKTGKAPNQAQLKARAWLKGLIEMQESTKSPLEFIENVKIDLFPDEVYVFTPKGQIMELPHGATAVDFAYVVHSDIGNSCIAAKINRRLSPLSTVLRNGQTIEIITAPGARPNPAWLNFVKTSKARHNIRHFIKDQKRDESVALGKELLTKAMHTLATNIEQVSHTKLHEFLHERNYKTLDDLYEAIGLGNQLPLLVARQLAVDHRTKEGKQEHATPTQPVYIKGGKGMVVNFAECCRPIPGDPIVGVFNPGQGLTVHASLCTHIARLCANPEKCIAVRWEEGIKSEFSVQLRVIVHNERGVLAKLASTIASCDANIEDINVNSEEGRFTTVNLLISVRNRTHLARIMRRLRDLRTVVKIIRCR